MSVQVSEAKQKLEQAIGQLGLTVESVFIPFSQSRNKAEKMPSLNWEVTIKRNGRHVLNCEYSAGMAHCPAYKKIGRPWERMAVDGMRTIRWECEKGLKAKYLPNISYITGNGKIEPDTCDVIHSIINDSSAINSGSFEEWASEFGYDTDSLKAKKIYKQCLKHGLKLKAAISQAGIDLLQEACQDY